MRSILRSVLVAAVIVLLTQLKAAAQFAGIPAVPNVITPAASIDSLRLVPSAAEIQVSPGNTSPSEPAHQTLENYFKTYRAVAVSS